LINIVIKGNREMRNIFLTTFFILSLSRADAQTQKEVNASSLVEIIDKADFESLKKLASSLSYYVLDSTVNSDGSFFYFTREPKLHGNTLACRADEKAKVKELTFITFVKDDYNALKVQLKKLGFVSSGVHKGNGVKVIESEDFEKGKIFASTSIVKSKKDGSLEYEFTFLKW
jgi:hypothetical protein